MMTYISMDEEHPKMRRALFVGALLFCAVVTLGFVVETQIVLGNNSYTQRFEQPWFRVPHSDHSRVEVADIDNSGFGKHFVPDEDLFIPFDWTEEEARYVPCLDRKCVCPFFGGEMEGDNCVVNNKTTLARAHRQEIRTLSNHKRRQWEYVLNWMKKNGMYTRLSRIHKYSGVHSGPAFTIWHREFLKRVELVIRRLLPDINMGVPYWDSSLDAYLPDPHDSIIFSPIFLGETDEKGLVINGPYANWTTMEGRPHILREFHSDPSGELLNHARIDWLVNNDDINMILGTTMPLTTCPMNHTLDARMLEYSHDYVHFFVSGDMGRSHSSSNDVIFIYHHSMIDLIFESWRQTKQTRTQREREYPKSDPTCFPYWHNLDRFMPMLQPLKNRDGLSNGYTDEMYEFAPRPTCTRGTGDCGSEYLFCGTSEEGEPICMSKVKMGGNCKGFEGTRICYKGHCREGKCTQRSKPVKKFDAKAQLFM